MSWDGDFTICADFRLENMTDHRNPVNIRYTYGRYTCFPVPFQEPPGFSSRYLLPDRDRNRTYLLDSIANIAAPISTRISQKHSEEPEWMPPKT
jgi:hypothetical protein